MTFEQFQATRKHCNDLGKALGDARWEDGPAGTGFLYLDALYIEDVPSHWPDAAKAQGNHYLILERCEWITDDLESLERRLYEFAVSAGYSI
jgi:hypothetical protein